MTLPELPTCRDTTVSVSTHAWMIGSQWSRCQRSGRPIMCGRSGMLMPVKPRSALRWISATAASGSLRNAMPSGMMRVGCAVYHSSNSQSFHARMHAWPSSGSLALKNTRPQNPVTIDGKLTAAHTPLRSMSRTRASTS